MIGLLQNSLERINSLQNYYQKEFKAIKRRSYKTLRENRLGYIIDYYFSVLASEDKDEIMKNDSFKNLQKYVDRNIEILDQKQIDKNRSQFRYDIKNPDKLKSLNYNLNIREASILYKQCYDMSVIHANNTLIMLLIRFEEFISNTFRILYDMYPDKYLYSKTIAYLDIKDLNSKEIRATIINHEIEALMRDSYTKWFELLKSHDISLELCKDQLDDIKEIYARRNIIVHNSGIVNKTYIKNSGNKKVKVGEYIGINDEYIANAFNCIKTILFVIVIQSFKLFKSTENNYLEEVFTIAFSELSSKNYYTSKIVFEILKNHKMLSDEFKNMSRVNYMIAANEMRISIATELETFDVTPLENRFKIAKLILQKKFKEATLLLEDEIANENIVVEMFEWPLYIHYIKSAEFKELKSKYKEFFESNVIDTDDLKPSAVKIIGRSITKDVEESKKEEKK